MVDLPIKHGESFHGFFYVYQAGYYMWHTQKPAHVLLTSDGKSERCRLAATCRVSSAFLAQNQSLILWLFHIAMGNG